MKPCIRNISGQPSTQEGLLSELVSPPSPKAPVFTTFARHFTHVSGLQIRNQSSPVHVDIACGKYIFDRDLGQSHYVGCVFCAHDTVGQNAGI